MYRFDAGLKLLGIRQSKILRYNMSINSQNRAVGIFATRAQAEQALYELKAADFPMSKVSIISKDADSQQKMAGVNVQHQVGNKADKGAASGAVTGGALGGLTGLLVGLGTLAIPGVGPIILAGEVATALATTVVGGAIGAAAGGLVGGLVGLGIPEERARVYSDRIARGEFLVIVDGSDHEMEIAQSILSNRGIQEWGVYEASTSAAASNNYASNNNPVVAPMASPNPIDRTTSPQSLAQQRRAVGVFGSREAAESALQELKNAGFSMNQVSVVARDTDQSAKIADVEVTNRVGNKADEGAATGVVTGGAVGGMGGLLVGLGALAIPGIGPVILAGVVATTLATALSGAAIGAVAGGLMGALVGLGIPDERARYYNDRITEGDYLVIVDGTETDLSQAKEILANRGIQDWGQFDIPERDHRRAHVGNGL
jgi:hypothetical protein